jgi:cyclic pyranopterin phosphate synthase
MLNQQLPFPVVQELLDDAKQLTIPAVNFYGGEPLLHPDLPRMVAHATQLGLQTSLTTNAIILREKVDALYEAGLRNIGIGFYGVEAQYNDYVQRKDSFARMEAGIAYTRERFGSDVRLCLYWLLMRPTCHLQALHELWQFAVRYAIPIGICLIHYSFPYFTEGPEHQLQFRSEDRLAIEQVVAELLRLKRIRPDLVGNSIMGLRSIPDWLLKKGDMRIPCTMYRKIWVGADGGVYVCQLSHKLGNLYEKRLADIVFTPEHRRSARACFRLDCPNCHTDYDGRIQVHAPSRALYAKEQPFERADIS